MNAAPHPIDCWLKGLLFPRSTSSETVSQTAVDWGHQHLGQVQHLILHECFGCLCCFLKQTPS